MSMLTAPFAPARADELIVSEITVTASPSPATFGRQVTVTATIDTLGQPAASGPVAFSHGPNAFALSSLGVGNLAEIPFTATSIASGAYHTCASSTSGRVWCWGFEASGQLGLGTPTGIPFSTPQLVPDLFDVTTVVAGGEHTCALLKDGAVKCWGNNTLGQLGDGSFTQRNSPVQTTGLIGVKALTAGANHTCAIRSDSRVLCWGSNTIGQIGAHDEGLAATADPRLVQTLSGDLQGISAISANSSGNHTCATSAQTISCWGRNTSGQLGDGTFANKDYAVSYEFSDTLTAVAAGGNHTCILNAAGAAKCWGNSAFGQNGGEVDTNSPPTETFGNIEGAIAVTAGNNFNCVLYPVGSVSCWGQNSLGQTGNTFNNNSLYSNGLTQFGPSGQEAYPQGAVAVAAGEDQSCALSRNGSVTCWGNNNSFQLGSTQSAYTSTPTPVPNFSLLNRATAQFETLGNEIPQGQTFVFANFPTTSTHQGTFADTSLTVNAPPTVVTDTVVTTTPNPSLANAPVTVAVTVLVTPPPPESAQRGTLDVVPPTGTVTLTISGIEQQLETPLVNSRATFELDGPPVAGLYSLTATYSGDDTFIGSTSDTHTHVVGIETQTSLEASSEGITFGETVTLTATVSAQVGAASSQTSAITPANGGGPTGTVAFSDGDTLLGTAPLNGNTAILTTSALNAGDRSIVASYSGQGEQGIYQRSTSEPVNILVGKTQANVNFFLTRSSLIGEGTTLYADVSTSLVNTGSVGTTAGGPPKPTGIVEFRRGTTVLASVNLSNGVASTVKELPFGELQISAHYLGSANYLAASAGPFPHQVSYADQEEVYIPVNSAEHQAFPELASLPVGAVAAWRDFSPASPTAQGIMVRRLSAYIGWDSLASRVRGQEDVSNSGDIRVAPRLPGQALGGVAGLTNGDFVVTWHVLSTVGATTRGSVFVRRFGPDGTPRAAAVRIATPATWVNSQPVVTELPQGRFVVAWQANGADGSGAAVAYLLHDALGRPIGTPLIANSTRIGWQGTPAIDTLSTGGFVIGWLGTSGTGAGIFVRPFAANGAPIGVDVAVTPKTSTTDSSNVAIASFTQGRFVVTWTQGETTRPNAPRDIFYRVYANTGAPLSVGARANPVPFGDQRNQTVNTFADGSFAIGWTDGATTTPVLNAQMFSFANVRQNVPFIVNPSRDFAVSQATSRQLGGTDRALAIWMTYSKGNTWDILGRSIRQLTVPSPRP